MDMFLAYPPVAMTLVLFPLPVPEIDAIGIDCLALTPTGGGRCQAG